MASSLNALDVSAPTQDLMFMLASNVNLSNFVTVKFSSQSDYHIWKAQMLCLIDSQMLRGIIDTGFPLPEGMDSNMIKRYDTLIKGWILGSVDERLLGNLVLFESARQLWKELESYVNAQINSSTDDSSLGFMFRAKLASIPEIECTEHIKRKMELYEATVEGRWWKAMSILKNHEDVATKAISENGNTMLHLAVEMRHNFFVEQLLIFLGNGTDVENRNVDGQTALHAAAMVGNKRAAQLLVQKRKQLLSILDNKKQSPLDIAYKNLKLNTYVYLLTLSPSYDLSRYPDDYTKNAVRLILNSIQWKQYDNALILLQKYPELALKTDEILMTMATTFPTDLGSIESFIYPSLNNVHQKILVSGSLLLDYDISCKCAGNISWVRKIWQNTSYSWLMKISMILLGYNGYSIKIIERKKKEQKEALKVLSLICEQMGTSRSCYNGPIIEAVRRDAYRVVDEILYCSPDTINCQDEQGHNVIQLAIINRAEKVYNLIYHIIERTESYRTMKDSSMNNLAHLAARLAPSFVLDSSTVAALQLQRDRQWREEVEKLLSPLELKEQNMYMETPAMLFQRDHTNLIKKGENWAKSTAESSSIIAALNVTVAFAAAITVPGGSNQNSGIPLFNKKFAFSTFGVSNAFSLFTSVTALLLFLSVITTGFSEKVSGLSSPRMLIAGLFTLFLSTTSMMIAFGAVLFLVFCDHGPWTLYPLFVFACIPIWVIVIIKLPLMVALIRSSFFPILGKKSYINHCKINPKNTIFFNKLSHSGSAL